MVKSNTVKDHTVERIKIAGAALNQTPLDWEGNLANVLEAITQARREGVQVLCLPELCLSGYGCEDAFHGEWVARQAWAGLLRLLPETRGMAVAVGLPVLHGQSLYNCAALLADGHLVGLSAKQVLAGYGVYYEPRWFQPWPAGRVEALEWEHGAVPLGDLLFDLGGVRLGFEICEDAWAWESGPGGGLAGQTDLILNPSASHFALGKHETVRGIVRESARRNHAVYLYTNLQGNEAGRLIFDGTVLAASDGAIVASSPRFSYRGVSLTTAVVDLRRNRLERRRLAYPAPTATTGGPLEISVPFTPAPCEEAPDPPETGPEAPMERDGEFAAAVALGLWDYLRKSHARGFTLSLSGGVDSASVATLCWVMASNALAELGWEGVQRALPFLEGPPVDAGVASRAGENAGAAQARALTQALLRTVYQATAQSSHTTRDAAREVASATGAHHVEMGIQELVDGYEALAGKALGRTLDWERDDLARQNIQARVRSPGVWLLANLEGRLLLSTSNRSEVGVGYTTMDGDTSGGLAPIAGANKSFLRAWLHRVETRGLPAMGAAPALPALPALRAVNAQQPTAELRPAEAAQEDEKDLMPYVLLDAIEQAAIRDRMAPVQVWRTLLESPPPGIRMEPAELAAHVHTFFRLWSATQWKRERLAPSFHLDDENLDPRTWCRFPILTGGYKTELEQLQSALEDHLAALPRINQANRHADKVEKT